MKKSVKWMLIAVVMVAMVLAVGRVGLKRQHQSTTSDIASAPQQGYRMPPFTLTEYPNNKIVNTNDLMGKPIFINFWASWCPPCQMETPDIVKAYKQYGNQVVFLSVNVTSQDKIPDALKFIKDFGITWPVALDQTGRIMQKYEVIGFPTSFFVNRKGIIDNVNVGAISTEGLNAELKRISE